MRTNNPVTQLDLDRQQHQIAHEAAKVEAEAAALDKQRQAAAAAAKAAAPATITFGISRGSHFQRRKPRASSTLVKHSVELKLSTLTELLLEWYGINPRVSTNRPSLAKKGIYRTAIKSSGWMDVVNGGVKMSVKSATVNDAGDEITIHMDDKELHGVFDGGHTIFFCLEILKDMLADGKLDSWDAYVEADFYTGVENKSTIKDMTEGHNTRNPVDQYLISNAGGEYDILKENLKDAWFHDKISWKGEKGGIQIPLIARIISLVNKHKFPGKKENPLRFDFESKNGSDDNTINDLLAYQHSIAFAPDKPNKNGTFDEYNNSMKILFENALDILELRDLIEKFIFDDFRLNMINVFNGTGKLKTPILTDGIGRALKFTQTSDGKPIRIKSKKCDMWTYSILSAMRANINWDSHKGTMSFIIENNEDVLNAAMPELIKLIAASHKRGGNKPDSLRTDNELQSKLYTVVNKHVKELQQNSVVQTVAAATA